MDLVALERQGRRWLIAALAFGLLLFRTSAVDAFMPSHRRPPQHHMAGFLDKFFDGLSNNNNESDKIGPNNDVLEDMDGIYTGSKRIITIPGK